MVVVIKKHKNPTERPIVEPAAQNCKCKQIPPPPEPPLGRVLREGSVVFCSNCGSTATKKGFLGLFGERLCDNKKCPNSKPRFK